MGTTRSLSLRDCCAAVVLLAVFCTASYGQSVTGFTLVNANTNADIGPLGDGDTIDLSQVGSALTARANVSGPVGSVRFAVNGNNNAQTESVAPYALAGDTNGDYNPWSLGVGTHTVTATPYTQAGAGGTAGTPKTITFSITAGTTPPPPPPPPAGRVFEEVDGLVGVEAEHYDSKSDNGTPREWYLTNPLETPNVTPDGDGNHAGSASNNAYMEILPDTRRTHDDPLQTGTNFWPNGGQGPILSYKVHFNTPGTYLVWVRCYSTGSEDNGLHVGINGTWPGSGERIQWCNGKNKWTWSSAQRTNQNHCGEPRQIKITVPSAGTHTISFSGREDGFEMDKFVMALDHSYTPSGAGPEERLYNPGGSGVSGELRQWHKVTVTFDGPNTSENATPNPFLDYRLDVTFTHSDGTQYVVPGYYAADGDAANTGATGGNKWRVHFAPDRTGTWTYTASFKTGNNVAVNGGGSATAFDGASGTFDVGPTNKTGRDFRAKGRLQYVGGHYLRFAGTGEYFLKQGPDAPENLLAYQDFDGPFKNDGVKDNLIKDFNPHVGDWNSGDPTWQGGKGKGLIGAINYLASEGMNVFSFLPMNIAGDDRNVFPYTNYNERVRMDVSRLDQWEIVFEHGTRKGMFLHFKTQETENDQLLDGGNLGTQRKLYYRELVARFGHHLGLNWNLGEENTNTDSQRKAFSDYFAAIDPYDHPVVVHTYPGQDNSVYTPLLGHATFHGTSLQTSNSAFSQVHGRVKEWVDKSANSGRKWIIACDEPGDASHALRPDNDAGNSHEDGRKNALWGTFLAGGWGNEWYFGYQHAHSDLTLNDFRSRDNWWDYCRYSLEFFEDNDVPFWEMKNNNGKSTANNDYCFFKNGEVYVVYLKNGGTTDLDLRGVAGTFEVKWFDPRNGGNLQNGSVTSVQGGDFRSLGSAPNNGGKDWTILVRRTDDAPLEPPVVIITDPNPGDEFDAPANFTVTAIADDLDGTVEGVELFVNGESQGVQTSDYSWDLSNLLGGNYTLLAVATDNDGLTAQSTVNVTVNNLTPPVVNFTNPNNGTGFDEPASFTVTTTASDADGTVQSVELFVNGDSQGVRTSNYSWNLAGLPAGQYTLLAIATDNDGLTGQSTISVTVNTPTPNDFAVVRFILVNADTDQDIRELVDGDTINLRVVGTSLSVRAETIGPADSVVFNLDGSNIQTESHLPYAIAGDNSGDYHPWTPSLGSHVLTGTPFAQNSGTGEQGDALTIGFNVIDEDPTPPFAVTRFVLVNADTDQDIRELNSGDEINFAVDGENLNVRAEVTGPVESVRFALDGNSNFQTENIPAYALAGNSGPDYNPWTPSVGPHTLTATPYDENRAGGNAGDALTINFTVVDRPIAPLAVTLVDDAYTENGNGKDDAYLKVENSSVRQRVIYLKYNVSNSRGRDTLLALLNLTVAGDEGGGTFRVHLGSHSNWDESSLSGANAPQPTTLINTQIGSMTNGSVLSFDVTSAINGDGDYTFIITMDEDATANDVWYSSDTGPTPPVLSLTLQP